MTTTRTTSYPVPPLYPPRYDTVGPTCQLCYDTGHAARSCPTHLNAVEANRVLLATVNALQQRQLEQTQRLAALDDQVKGLIKQVDALIEQVVEDVNEDIVLYHDEV